MRTYKLWIEQEGFSSAMQVSANTAQEALRKFLLRNKTGYWRGVVYSEEWGGGEIKLVKHTTTINKSGELTNVQSYEIGAKNATKCNRLW